MRPAESPRCPVCRATFRRQRICPRCGADLTILMCLAGQSWQARQAARAALRSGDLEAARQHAAHAQQLCDSPAGRSLLSFATSLQHVMWRVGSFAPSAPQ